jgi:hypothetical protein
MLYVGDGFRTGKEYREEIDSMKAYITNDETLRKIFSEFYTNILMVV